MAPDLCLVPHAAEGHAHEFAIRRTGDRLSERRLADTGRSDEAKHGALDLADAPLHRKILDDTLLHFLQTVVVGLENLLRSLEIPTRAASLLPWAAPATSQDTRE